MFFYTRCSAIADRPARRCLSDEMLSYCCCWMNYPYRSHVSLRSTFGNCHVAFRYLHSFVLYTHRSTKLNYSLQHSQHAMFRVTSMSKPLVSLSSTDFHTTNVVDVNWTVTAITKVRLYQLNCWWHRVFLRQHTAVDADHRGEWTQIIGGNSSKPKNSRLDRSKNTICTYSICILAPSLKVIPSEFRRYLLHRKNWSLWAILRHCLLKSYI